MESYFILVCLEVSLCPSLNRRSFLIYWFFNIGVWSKMKAGDCVNLIFPRVLSSNNEVSVRFSQVTLTRRGSQAGCWAHSIHLGYQGSQIKLKGWVVVSKNPWLLKVNTFKAPADLSCSAWHPTDTNPLSSHLLGKCPGYPRVCRCFSHWICSPVHCRGASCQVSLELAQATIYDLSPHWSFTSCLTLQTPSGLSQLWGCGLGSRIPKSHHHQLDTPGTVCKQIATEQDKHYQISLNAGVAQDQYHTHRSAWSFFLSYSK